MDNNINLNLTPDEALVLFELLSKYEKVEQVIFEDNSEKQILILLLGKLESILVEPFKANYLDLLNESRKRIKEKYGM